MDRYRGALVSRTIAAAERARSRSFTASWQHEVAACILMALIHGCSSDGKPRQSSAPARASASGSASWTPRSPVQLADASAGDTTAQNVPPPASDEDAGPPAPESMPAAGAVDAGATNTGAPNQPAPNQPAPNQPAPNQPAMPDEPEAPDTNVLCPRAELQSRAEAYFSAMAMRDASSLALHPSVRYTENGEEMRLETGIWRTSPDIQFIRHVLDEERCTSISEAVLTSARGRIIFGVRLRYVDDSLVDAEAHVVTQNLTYYDPDGMIPVGSDPWIAPIEPAQRSTADAIAEVAARFIDGAADPTILPPTSATCVLRQNGVVVTSNCLTLPPEGERFEQVRYPVVDATIGVATAIARRRGYIFILLFKVQGGTLDNVEVVGGASSQTTGW